MGNYLSTLKKSAGFTLIELLVVIGILGILATTLIATIDPFEQIKKAQDTKVQNVAVEFQTALVRYYTGQNAFPWQQAATATNTCKADSGATGTVPDDVISTGKTLDLIKGTNSCIGQLISVGELKAGFSEVTGVLDKITLSEVTALKPVVCYKPTSKSGQADKAVVYSDALGTRNVTLAGNSACKADDPTSTNVSCYWCTK